MLRPLTEATVLVVGLGDLGGRTVDALATLPLARLVAGARDPARARAVAGRAALIGDLRGGPRRVDAVRIDLDEPDATAAALAALAPDVIVAGASRHSWWRTPERLRAIPYAAWLSLQVPLVRAVTAGRAAAAPDARVVALPHPDAVGPVLAARGLAPDLGAGNVAEIAAKLRHLAAARAAVPREHVRVRLVAHHAAEKFAFEGIGAHLGPGTPPPVRAEVTVDGRRLGEDEVRELLRVPYALGARLETHQLTAAATAALVAGLLADEPQALHAPAPGGRPGGYPVLVSRAGIELDLPAGMTEHDACAINAVAARWDGIEHVDDDGTLVFTDEVADLTERLLGLRLERVAPDGHEAVGAELLARAAAAA